MESDNEAPLALLEGHLGHSCMSGLPLSKHIFVFRVLYSGSQFIKPGTNYFHRDGSTDQRNVQALVHPKDPNGEPVLN